MARIFIEHEVESRCIGHCLYYSLMNGILRVEWSGTARAQRAGVKPGDAFIVALDYNDVTVKLTKLKLPHRNDDLLMWLLGFTKNQRTHDYKEYTEMRQRTLQNSERRISKERAILGANYDFNFGFDDTGKLMRIAAYANCSVDKELVKTVINEWTDKFAMPLPFPTCFIEMVMRDRFGFKDDEIKVHDSLLDLAYASV